MRRARVLVLSIGMIIGMLAVPAGAMVERLDGPTSIWLSDPDGPGGVEQGDQVAGTFGAAQVAGRNATVRLTTTGLEPGHTYTMWIVYFNDKTACTPGCGPDDVPNPAVGAGVLFGDGKIAGGTGGATFVGHLQNGDGADVLGPPPPPFAFAPFAAGPDNEFHAVIRSHGPKGDVAAQIHEFGGGCEVDIGPLPGEDVFPPVPSEPGECGDVQVHIFQ